MFSSNVLGRVKVGVRFDEKWLAASSVEWANSTDVITELNVRAKIVELRQAMSEKKAVDTLAADKVLTFLKEHKEISLTDEERALLASIEKQRTQVSKDTSNELDIVKFMNGVEDVMKSIESQIKKDPVKAIGDVFDRSKNLAPDQKIIAGSTLLGFLRKDGYDISVQAGGVVVMKDGTRRDDIERAFQESWISMYDISKYDSYTADKILDPETAEKRAVTLLKKGNILIEGQTIEQLRKANDAEKQAYYTRIAQSNLDNKEKAYLRTYLHTSGTMKDVIDAHKMVAGAEKEVEKGPMTQKDWANFARNPASGTANFLSRMGPVPAAASIMLAIWMVITWGGAEGTMSRRIAYALGAVAGFGTLKAFGITESVAKYIENPSAPDANGVIGKAKDWANTLWWKITGAVDLGAAWFEYRDVELNTTVGGTQARRSLLKSSYNDLLSTTNDPVKWLAVLAPKKDQKDLDVETGESIIKLVNDLQESAIKKLGDSNSEMNKQKLSELFEKIRKEQRAESVESVITLVARIKNGENLQKPVETQSANNTNTNETQTWEQTKTKVKELITKDYKTGLFFQLDGKTALNKDDLLKAINTFKDRSKAKELIEKLKPNKEGEKLQKDIIELLK